jgi:hypothetical protein
MMTPEEMRERAESYARSGDEEMWLCGETVALIFSTLAELADQLKALRERVEGLEARGTEPQNVPEPVQQKAWVSSPDQPSEVYCRKCLHPRGGHDHYGCSVGREFDSTFVCRCSVRYDDD